MIEWNEIMKDQKYKLIVSDIDRTLLQKDFLIPDYNIKMVQRAREKGVEFMLCTGRFFGSARPYCKYLGIDLPIISSNGAAVVDYYSWEPVIAHPIPVDVVCDLFNLLDELRIHYHFYTDRRFYVREGLNDGDFRQKHNINLPPEEQYEVLEIDNPCEIAQQERVYKIACRCPSEEEDQRFRRGFCGNDKISITSSFTYVYEIQAAGVNKGASLAEYAAMRGIRPEEILAIGDNHNDIEMIRWAGTGVAVGNALDILKEEADYITDNAEDGGVGKVIAKFILGEDPEEGE